MTWILITVINGVLIFSAPETEDVCNMAAKRLQSTDHMGVCVKTTTPFDEGLYVGRITLGDPS
jgi:hypothetical protein